MKPLVKNGLGAGADAGPSYDNLRRGVLRQGDVCAHAMSKDVLHLHCLCQALRGLRVRRLFSKVLD